MTSKEAERLVLIALVVVESLLLIVFAALMIKYAPH
jgi:cytochrome c oxidase subunit IV